MNDDIREKLSAYLDGALTDQERRAIELEISRSEEMSRELEALRAVSNAIKGLPKEKLPAGFMARLEARRARDTTSQREYFILPPSYRPVAFALSTALVAFVVWDKTRAPEDMSYPTIGWQGGKVAVKSAADAPASIDVTGKLSALGARGLANVGAAEEASVASSEPRAPSAKKEDAAGGNVGAASTFGKHLNAPGQPLEFPEDKAPAPPPARDALEPAQGQGGALVARNEEERSAINERLYKGFEEEKKRMGIARILEKDADAKKPDSGVRDTMLLQASPEAAHVNRTRSTALRGAKAKRQSSPIVKAIALKSPEALQAAWSAAGLAGEPPEVNFPGQMAVFLAGPAGCGIVDVQNRQKFIVVLYKDAGFDDPAARVRAVALSPKPVVVKLAQ